MDEVKCLKCKGLGMLYSIDKGVHECDNCDGFGTVYKIVSPKQYKESTGEEWNGLMWIGKNNVWNLHKKVPLVCTIPNDYDIMCVIVDQHTSKRIERVE